MDVASRQVVRTVDVGFAPNGFAVHPDGRLLYVSSFLDGNVTEIDMATGTPRRTFPIGGTPQELALNRNGTRLYVANEEGHLDEIDLGTGQSLPPIPLPGGGFGIGVSHNDGLALRDRPPPRSWSRSFPCRLASSAGTIHVGGEPRRIAFSQRGDIAAVTNQAGFVNFLR